jgi:hypothetical protein
MGDTQGAPQARWMDARGCLDPADRTEGQLHVKAMDCCICFRLFELLGLFGV